MEIVTQRLRLREMARDDVPAVLAYQRDPRYLRFYPAEGRTEAAVADLVERLVGWSEERPRARFQLGITLAGSGELIGNVGIRRANAFAEAAELGFELDPRHWGRGYATEAARAMVEFGFSELGLHRVHAHCIADNQGSRRVLLRLGMREEGRLRESECFKGRHWDVLLFGLLARELEPAPRAWSLVTPP